MPLFDTDPVGSKHVRTGKMIHAYQSMKACTRCLLLNPTGYVAPGSEPQGKDSADSMDIWVVSELVRVEWRGVQCY